MRNITERMPCWLSSDGLLNLIAESTSLTDVWCETINTNEQDKWETLAEKGLRVPCPQKLPYGFLSRFPFLILHSLSLTVTWLLLTHGARPRARRECLESAKQCISLRRPRDSRMQGQFWACPESLAILWLSYSWYTDQCGPTSAVQKPDHFQTCTDLLVNHEFKVRDGRS